MRTIISVPVNRVVECVVNRVVDNPVENTVTFWFVVLISLYAYAMW